VRDVERADRDPGCLATDRPPCLLRRRHPFRAAKAHSGKRRRPARGALNNHAGAETLEESQLLLIRWQLAVGKPTAAVSVR
jgi:hypothetical protein